jgi:hypothetical protein
VRRIDADREVFATIRALYLNVFDEIHVATLGGYFEFQAGRVTPKVFQRVVGPLLLRKNVNHDFPIVCYDPLTLRESVHHQRLHAMVFPKAFLQFIGDRLEMRLARPGADQEKIGERGNATQVDGDDALRLLVGSYFGTKLGETFGVDGGGRVKYCGKAGAAR